ncbi:hypothetical protein INH39_09240 [Massilia violaceinigra]|uniref:Uncharacterized protein n=1 Tax=Massilia violaceinigra TaxID=2045208 RepID=A0ABY4AH05_9BURK|nr:hypothetical protein [Massilia violaceinigra]UOD33697.1 hypothetical protein INH39_09240 [Massilia violaceinigra]
MIAYFYKACERARWQTRRCPGTVAGLMLKNKDSELSLGVIFVEVHVVPGLGLGTAGAHGRCSRQRGTYKKKTGGMPEDCLGMGMGLTANTKIDWRTERAQPRSSDHPLHSDVRML